MRGAMFPTKWALVLVSALLLLVPLARLAAAQPIQGATLTVLRGQVAVVRPDGSAVQPAPSGTSVMPGDDIRTLTQSGALITFFVGTEIELGEATVLRVDQISRQGDQIDVSLTQVYGSAVHRVQALANTGSSYRVEAGGAVALVRGTEFGWWYYPPSVHVLGVFEGMVECLDQQEANNPNSPAQSDPNRLRTEGGYISQSNSCAVSDTFKIDKDDPWGTLSRGLGIALVQSNPAESGDEDDDEELADAEEEEEEEEEEQSQDEPDDRDDGDDGGDQDDGDDGGDDDDGDDGGDDDDGDGGDDDDDGGDDGGDEDDD